MKKIIAYSSLVLIVGCDKVIEIKDTEVVDEKPFTISELVGGGVFWEGSQSQFKDYFVEDNTLRIKELDKNFTGTYKVRTRQGVSFSFGTYLNGLKHGDFYTWHDNGKLKSKRQYSYNMRHGYHYEWAHDGKIWSRKKYEDDLEVIGWFEDEGISEQNEDMASYELKDWNGTGKQFYIKFAGDPKEGGFLHIRETGKPYTGKITAFDDFGRKEAVMRFKNGKYEGVISHWDENGRLVDEKEYERGKLITYTIKNGKAFDPNQVITLTEDNISMLFE
tara:strand:- start:217 stop:1044 length:828 start_codon:yes stop_codon:yes gene_type:complete